MVKMIQIKHTEAGGMFKDIQLEFWSYSSNWSKVDVTLNDRRREWSDVVLSEPKISPFVKITAKSTYGDKHKNYGFSDVLVFSCKETGTYNIGEYTYIPRIIYMCVCYGY